MHHLQSLRVRFEREIRKTWKSIQIVEKFGEAHISPSCDAKCLWNSSYSTFQTCIIVRYPCLTSNFFKVSYFSSFRSLIPLSCEKSSLWMGVLVFQ